MTARSQTLVLTLLGLVGIKLVLTQTYLRYVNAYMKWPLVLTGLLLLTLSLRYLFSDERLVASETAPVAAWALVVPVLVVFVISPPALGAYVAEHRPAATPPPPADDSAIPPLPKTSPVRLEIIEFDTRAQWDTRSSLKGRQVEMDGFATHKRAGGWFLTRLATTCCAADAVAWHVQIEGLPAPPVGRWVRVTGVWHDPGTAVPRHGTPTLDATHMTPIRQPVRPYM